MSWNDITEHDLVEGSKGVEEDEHDSPRCQPLVENGIYRKASELLARSLPASEIVIVKSIVEKSVIEFYNNSYIGNICAYRWCKYSWRQWM